MSVTVLLSLKPAQSFCRRSLHSTASRHRWRKWLIQSFTAFWTSSDFRPRKLFAGLKTSSNRTAQSVPLYRQEERLTQRAQRSQRLPKHNKEEAIGKPSFGKPLYFLCDLGVSLLSAPHDPPWVPSELQLNRNIFENAVAPLEKRANLCVPA